MSLQELQQEEIRALLSKMDSAAKPNRIKLPAIFNSQNGNLPQPDPKNYLKASPKISQSNSPDLDRLSS